MTFFIKRNDTAPAIRYALINVNGPVDLTGASVRFYMQGTGAFSIAAPATIENAGDGIVSYAWQVGDTAVAGAYRAEFEVVYADGAKETFPNSKYIVVSIDADLGEPDA